MYPHITKLDDLPKGIFTAYQNYIGSRTTLVWRNEIQALKSIFARLCRADLCDDRLELYVRRIPTPYAIPKKRNILSFEEIRKLLKYIEKDNRKFYFVTYFLAKLGWRVAETLSVKEENIRWEDGKPVSILIEKEFRKNRREFVLETIDPKLGAVIKEALAFNRQKEKN